MQQIEKRLQKLFTFVDISRCRSLQYSREVSDSWLSDFSLIFYFYFENNLFPQHLISVNYFSSAVPPGNHCFGQCCLNSRDGIACNGKSPIRLIFIVKIKSNKDIRVLECRGFLTVQWVFFMFKIYQFFQCSVHIVSITENSDILEFFWLLCPEINASTFIYFQQCAYLK